MSCLFSDDIAGGAKALHALAIGVTAYSHASTSKEERREREGRNNPLSKTNNEIISPNFLKNPFPKDRELFYRKEFRKMMLERRIETQVLRKGKNLQSFESIDFH